MSQGKMEAQTLGFVFGLTWDVFATDVFGNRTVMLTLIGYFIGMLKKNFDIDQTVTQIFVVSTASLIYYLGFNLISYNFVTNVDGLSLFSLSLRGVLGMGFTIAITPAIFFVLRKVFYLIEDK
jgi:rod shape-determining protein MreD